MSEMYEYDEEDIADLMDIVELQIENEKLNKEIERLNKENKELIELYQRTCTHLFNIGNDELARYFQAQINECNTFTTQGSDKE